MSRQHFKIGKGISLTPVTTRPADPENGDIIYNSTTGGFDKFVGGFWKSTTNFRASSTTGQTLPTGDSVLDFPTESYDSHNTWDTNTFTVGDVGKYYIHSRVVVLSSPGTSTIAMTIKVNSVIRSERTYPDTYLNGALYSFEITDTLFLETGDELTIVFSNGFGVSTTMSATANHNIITVHNVG